MNITIKQKGIELNIEVNNYSNNWQTENQYLVFYQR